MTIEYKDSKRIVASGIGGLDGVGGWKELGRTTLDSANDVISVASLPDKRYYMVLAHHIQNGSNPTPGFRFNGDTANNYNHRSSHNGGTDATGQVTSIYGDTLGGALSGGHWLTQLYIANKSDKEKLVIMNQTSNRGGTGAGTAPVRGEIVAKWANTSSSINQVSNFDANNTSGNFASGSEIVVLGWDPDDTHTSNFWEELASVDLSSGSADVINSGTISAKKYLWVQAFLDGTGEIDTNFQFNSDTGSNYSNRRAANGGSDGTGTGKPSIDLSASLASGSKCFQQAFIVNNSANEKLVIANNCTADATGAGTAPIRDETVGKWANTSSQITSVQIQNSKSGSYDTGTIMKVWGHD